MPEIFENVLRGHLGSVCLILPNFYGSGTRLISETGQNFILSENFEGRTNSRNIEELLKERGRLAEFGAEINCALVGKGDLPALLDRCARVLVNRLETTSARIWTINAEKTTLEMRAGAGARLPHDEDYFKIPVGHRKIGTIAENRLPWLVDDLGKDSRFTDKAWIKRAKMRAFAGYPLIVGGELVGVMCVFARHRLTDLTLQAMASVADAIAGGIRRKQSEEAHRRLLKRLEEARESERRHLSRELHDEIAQQLVVAAMKLQRAEKNILKLLPDEHSIIADIVVAQELLLRNQQSLRLMAHSLHSEILEHFGLPEALRRFVSDIKILATENSTVISLDSAPDFPRLKLAVETDIYRIVQEAVSNALKHARARVISIALKTAAGTGLIVIKDDGCGLNGDETLSDGIGFASMRERAQLIGSKISIRSHTGKGTKILLKVPLANNRRSKKS